MRYGCDCVLCVGQFGVVLASGCAAVSFVVCVFVCVCVLTFCCCEYRNYMNVWQRIIFSWRCFVIFLVYVN